MVCNGPVTIYHMRLNEETKLEEWTRYNYTNAWFFGGENAGINKGYDNANDFDCRIPYDKNKGLDYSNFAKGDIIIQGNIELDIISPKELNGYLKYNIVSLNNNNFGNNQHIHIGGK